jgi:hypothetical protein
MKALLSTTYFGPVQWYQKLYRSEEVVIEQWESFQKQTYRNRCLIATTQGIQALTVPIERGTSPLIKDIRISDHGNWRHLHWNAIISAYGESPFFEYYQDDIRPFFEKKWEFLLDFNEAIREKMCELLDIQPKVNYSSEFKVYSLEFKDYSLEFKVDSLEMNTQLAEKSTINYKQSTINKEIDFREGIRPKHPQPDPDFEAKPYYQVYQQKHGFLPNLSVLDLLMNMGPEGIFYL